MQHESGGWGSSILSSPKKVLDTAQRTLFISRRSFKLGKKRPALFSITLTLQENLQVMVAACGNGRSASYALKKCNEFSIFHLDVIWRKSVSHECADVVSATGFQAWNSPFAATLPTRCNSLCRQLSSTIFVHLLCMKCRSDFALNECFIAVCL